MATADHDLLPLEEGLAKDDAVDSLKLSKDELTPSHLNKVEQMEEPALQELNDKLDVKVVERTTHDYGDFDDNDQSPVSIDYAGANYTCPKRGICNNPVCRGEYLEIMTCSIVSAEERRAVQQSILKSMSKHHLAQGITPQTKTDEQRTNGSSLTVQESTQDALNGLDAGVTQLSDAPNHMRTFWLYDLTSGICYLNNEAMRYLGFSEDQEFLTAEDIKSIIKPKDEDRWQKIFSGNIQSNNIIEEVEIISGDAAGAVFTITGAILARDEHGFATIASGVIALSRHDHDRFFTQSLSTDGSWDWNLLSGELRCSYSYRKLLDYEPDDPFPTTMQEWFLKVLHPDDLKEILIDTRSILTSPEGGDAYEKCVRFRTKHGRYKWILDRGVVIERDSTGHATRIVGCCTDINIMGNMLDSTNHDAYTDTLTGLHNTAYLNVKRPFMESHAASPVSAIFIDVTGLKATNDYLGHDAGDAVLCTAAAILGAATAEIGTLVRLGGDEFIALIPSCSSFRLSMVVENIRTVREQHNKEAYKQLKERLSNPAVSQLTIGPHDQIPVFFGIGAATMGESENGISANSLRSLIELADIRCQVNKNALAPAIKMDIRKIIKLCLGYEPELIDERVVPSA